MQKSSVLARRLLIKSCVLVTENPHGKAFDCIVRRKKRSVKCAANVGNNDRIFIYPNNYTIVAFVHDDAMLAILFSRSEVLKLVCITKIITRVGPDTRSSSPPRHGAVDRTDALTSIINEVFVLSSTLDHWRPFTIVPIPKFADSVELAG